MSQRESNPLDPFVWRLVAGTPVWVAAKAAWESNGIMQLHGHRMQDDMDFCLPADPTIHQPDYSLPRLMPVPVPGEGGYTFRGMRLRFAAPQDGNTITNRSFASIDDVHDMTLESLLDEGYSVFYTGHNDFPFIVCRTSQYNPIIGEDGCRVKKTESPT